MTTKMNSIKEWVVEDATKFDGSVHAHLVDGKSPFSGTTIEEYLEMGYSVLTTEELQALEDQYKENLSKNWEEVSKKQFEYALNVLPPAKWQSGGFFVSEPYHYTLYPFYQSFNGKYYRSIQDIRRPRVEILNRLEEYLKNH